MVERSLPGGGGYMAVPDVWDSSINKDSPLPADYQGKGKAKAKETKK